MKNLGLFFFFIVLFLCGCNTTRDFTVKDFNSFNDDISHHDKFIGIWTEEVRKDFLNRDAYQIHEYRNDGTGVHTDFSNNEFEATTSFKFKTSDSKIVYLNSFANEYYTAGIFDYHFSDNNQTLILKSPIYYNFPPRIFHRTGSVQNVIDNKIINNALKNASDTLIQTLEKESRIAIINIFTENEELSEYISRELELILVNKGLFVVDRSQLDLIRKEQNFQLSGQVDDNFAVSIGKFAGANVVIVGEISGTGNMRRLRLRALNTETARVIGVGSEAF
jgi:hypothetical protein